MSLVSNLKTIIDRSLELLFTNFSCSWTSVILFVVGTALRWRCSGSSPASPKRLAVSRRGRWWTSWCGCCGRSSKRCPPFTPATIANRFWKKSTATSWWVIRLFNHVLTFANCRCFFVSFSHASTGSTKVTRNASRWRPSKPSWPIYAKPVSVLWSRVFANTRSTRIPTLAARSPNTNKRWES